MEIQITTDFKQVDQATKLVIEDLRDLTPILRKFAGYKRKRVQAIFDQQGPGWAPLKQSTAKVMASRLQRRAEGSLRGKLRRDVRRAESRYAGGTGKGKLSTLETRKEVLAEFERIVHAKHTGEAGTESKLDQKKAQKLGGRIERSQKRAEAKSGVILGRMASSIHVDMEPDGFSIKSKIPWSSVHNDGGTAGHGAQIPARKFLEWAPEDLPNLAEIARQHYLKKWNEG